MHGISEESGLISSSKGVRTSSWNLKVIAFLILYLMLQAAINLLMFFLLLILSISLLELESHSTTQLIVIWTISLVIGAIRTFINCYIGWKWESIDLPRPRIFHWILSYVIFIVIGVFCAAWFYPFEFPIEMSSLEVEDTRTGERTGPLITQEINIGPLLILAIISALDYFIVLGGLVVLVAGLATAPQSNSESDAAVGFYFMLAMLFYASGCLAFPLLPVIFFFFGRRIGRKNKSKSNYGADYSSYD